jgi:hypothetical protein
MSEKQASLEGSIKWMVLVRRAQWKINQSIPEERTSKLGKPF